MSREVPTIDGRGSIVKPDYPFDGKLLYNQLLARAALQTMLDEEIAKKRLDKEQARLKEQQMRFDQIKKNANIKHVVLWNQALDNVSPDNIMLDGVLLPAITKGQQRARSVVVNKVSRVYSKYKEDRHKTEVSEFEIRRVVGPNVIAVEAPLNEKDSEGRQAIFVIYVECKKALNSRDIILVIEAIRTFCGLVGISIAPAVHNSIKELLAGKPSIWLVCKEKAREMKAKLVKALAPVMKKIKERKKQIIIIVLALTVLTIALYYLYMYKKKKVSADVVKTLVTASTTKSSHDIVKEMKSADDAMNSGNIEQAGKQAVSVMKTLFTQPQI